MISPRMSAIAIMILLLGLLCSCERKAQEAEPGGIQISGAGATFPVPLYKKWIEEYRKAREDVAVSYEAVGSGEGTRKFMNQEVDFGASDAALNDEQIANMERGANLIPATAGIIVLAYNLKGLNGSLKLPRDVYVDIFSGAITSWNDPRIKGANPELNLPSKGIVLVTRLDSSGTTFAFTNHLSAVNKEWRDRGPGVGKVVQWPANTMTARGNEGVAGRIKISEGAIGYVEYGFATCGRIGYGVVGEQSRQLCRAHACQRPGHLNQRPGRNAQKSPHVFSRPFRSRLVPIGDLQLGPSLRKVFGPSKRCGGQRFCEMGYWRRTALCRTLGLLPRAIGCSRICEQGN